MRIQTGDREDQLRCLRENDMLCGLITKVPDGRWRVELLMKVDGVCTTKEEAIAFAQGCWATCEAFRIFARTGVQDVATATGGKVARTAAKG